MPPRYQGHTVAGRDTVESNVSLLRRLNKARARGNKEMVAKLEKQLLEVDVQGRRR